MNRLHEALGAAYGALSVWADLVDSINVFPVADGDTGTNLRISLEPLRRAGAEDIADRLAAGAIGNAGNIAAAFFLPLVQAETVDKLSAAAARGRDMAWQAVARPRRGTMLSVFDTLAADLARGRLDDCRELVANLGQTVARGPQELDELREAGVVDAGALAMYIFLAAFVQHVVGQDPVSVPVLEAFPGRLALGPDFQAPAADDYCVDMVIEPGDHAGSIRDQLARLGDSLVTREDAHRMKVHVHTSQPRRLQDQMAELGRIVHWSEDPIDTRKVGRQAGVTRQGAIHLVTDAAASLPEDLARSHNITLLDSYLVFQGRSRPERCCSAAEIYGLMRGGVRVTTAQPSAMERHQQFRSILDRFGPTLYLGVGSAFSGNLEAARHWQAAHDPDDRLQVVDSGAASGRLALIALLTARAIRQGAGRTEVLVLARQFCLQCREMVFIDELKYLVAGGRLSRTSGFFGDLLHLKPVISPQPEGVRKLGTVRSRAGQLDFALEHLQAAPPSREYPVVLVQYSDNRDWVKETACPRIRDLLPAAEIIVVPLSLSSGVHMGPGTWGVAYAEQRERQTP